MAGRRGSTRTTADGQVPAGAGEVSMRDVARHAGVSVATVSRVLNGSETVNALGRERVPASVAELGYRPNRLARNLRRHTAEMIGVVDVDGLVIANNLMAIGALHALAAHGRSVPEDVALVALDDPFWAALVQPPLTVLAQPVRAMADAAMRLLLERIGGAGGAPTHELFPFELRVRGSCGTQGTERKR